MSLNTPLSARRRWLAVVLIALGAFALVFIELLPVGMLPTVSRSLHVSEGTAGLVVTVTAWVAAVTAPLIPLAVGRLDRRWVLASLTLMLVISSLLAIVANSFTALLIARAVLGLAAGGFWAAGILAATALMPERAHTASSLVFGGIALGTVLSAPVGSFLVGFMQWNQVYAIGLVLGLLVFVLQLLLLPPIRAERAVGLRDFGAVLRSPALVTVLALVVLLVIGNFAGFTFITPYLQQVTHATPTTVSVLLLVYGLITFLGNFAGGQFAGKSSMATVVVTAILFVVGLGLLIAFGRSLPVVIGGLVLWALAWSATPVGTQVLLFVVANKAGHPVDAAQALNTSVFQASIGLGALVGGAAVNAAGVGSAMALATIVLTVALLTSIALSSALRRRARSVPGAGSELSDHELAAS
ncbi:MFS transporter [Streptomyces spiralis]|uniref:MFS transporter n=1 Tax=Streptomyces spiralis TaxID=66376 RepID=A0A918ZKV4_9ACTN|nr:MFS transporter [Streptomyces spiralis]GHE55204.1 MFS transporter [Streptomyces spiralis]